MVKLASAFGQLQPRKALVIGDFMMDRYTFGKVRRISPEAPVPVMNVEREECRPGGAGNVVLNLISLGMSIVAIGRVGNDLAGSALISLLNEEGVSTHSLLIQEGMHTPQKNRIIADFQQIVRIDHESVQPLLPSVENEIIESLPQAMQGIDIVAISDYAKGFLSQPILQAVIGEARKRNIPVIADPKGTDLSKYAGATIIKPNLDEAFAAAHLGPQASLEEVAQAIHRQVSADVLMITRSESGISLFYADGTVENFPVRAKQVKDVTGAGDTVLAVLACALANKLTLGEATEFANIAASIAIEQVGCARVTLSQIAHRLFDLHASQKIFYEEHFSALHQALRGRKSTLIVVDAESAHVNTSLLKAIRHLAKDHPNDDIVLYVQHSFPDEEFLNVMASLEAIDYVFFREDPLQKIISAIHPGKVFIYKDKQLQQLPMHALC